MGGDGDDTITGDKWPNELRGIRGANTVIGDGGNDVLFSDGEYSDRLYGPHESGAVDGGEGNDALFGGNGDALRGGNGNDRITVLTKGSGENLPSNVEGGAGDDRINARNRVVDTIDCGPGNDTVYYDPTRDTVTNCEKLKR